MNHPDLERIKGVMSGLSEHFDTVQIFASRHEDGSTFTVDCGCGHWYARFGQVRSWVRVMDEDELQRKARGNGES